MSNVQSVYKTRSFKEFIETQSHYSNVTKSNAVTLYSLGQYFWLNGGLKFAQDIKYYFPKATWKQICSYGRLGSFFHKEKHYFGLCVETFGEKEIKRRLSVLNQPNKDVVK